MRIRSQILLAVLWLLIVNAWANEMGGYTFSNQSPGMYGVTIAANGFRAQISRDVAIAATGALIRDLKRRGAAGFNASGLGRRIRAHADERGARQ